MRMVLIFFMFLLLLSKTTWIFGILLFLFIINYFKKEQALEDIG